jgi:uncharacterized circularly permuted ATP-grasp superfamily protein
VDAIKIFDDLQERDRAAYAGSIPGLREDLARGGAQYGGRDLVRVLRPKFVTSGEYETLRYVCGVIVQAARRLADRVLQSPELRAFVGLSEGEARLVEPPGLVADPCVLARLDSFQTQDGPKFVELNAEAPAGSGFGDVIAETFAEHPLIRELSARTGAFFVPNCDRLLETLLVCWRAAGKSKKPSILITDYLEARTVKEFHVIAERFRRGGFECVVEDPRRLSYEDGRLHAAGRPVDLVYRRVLANEFLDRESELQALWSAYRDGSVVLVNPFRCKLVHKKATFALLTGDGDDGWMTAEERRVIRAHVPWTRKVRECRTEWRGKAVDLLPFVNENRERFVLKPSDEYGGKGVVLGWECDQAAFERALREACSGCWVVQERVHPISETFPAFEPALEPVKMTVDLDPYLYFGHLHGMLARLAAGSISNVTSGGGQTPVMVVPDWPRATRREAAS